MWAYPSGEKLKMAEAARHDEGLGYISLADDERYTCSICQKPLRAGDYFLQEYDDSLQEPVCHYDCHAKREQGQRDAAKSDLSVLREMLTRAGVVFTEEHFDHAIVDNWLLGEEPIPPGTRLIIPDDHPPRNYGCADGSSAFFFDEHGALYGVGAWE